MVVHRRALSNLRTPTYVELRRFCREDRWDETKRTDHWRYTKRLADGTLLRVKVSFGSGQIQDPDLFGAILRDQLRVPRKEFWRAVDEGGPAVRPTLAPAAAAALPAWLWHQLLIAGARREQISALTVDAARSLLDRRRSRPR